MTGELQKARKYDHDVIALLNSIERSWVKLGQLCLEIQKNNYWSSLADDEGNAFGSFRDWMADRIGRRKSQIYSMMSALRELEMDISKEDLEQMTQANATLLSKVPRSKRQGLLHAAKHEPEKKFRKTIEHEAPGLLIESESPFTLMLDKSLCDFAWQVVELAKRVEQTDSAKVAFEAIFAEYNETHKDEVQECAATAAGGTGQ
jgi:hypothetical protein